MADSHCVKLYALILIRLWRYISHLLPYLVTYLLKEISELLCMKYRCVNLDLSK